jgi:nitroreductase
MFLQNVMIAARAHGTGDLRASRVRAVPPDDPTARPNPGRRTVLCGISLGYEDPDAPENRLQTERSPAADFAQFLGWEDPAR